MSFGDWENCYVKDILVNDICHLFYLEQNAMVHADEVSNVDPNTPIENFIDVRHVICNWCDIPYLFLSIPQGVGSDVWSAQGYRGARVRPGGGEESSQSGASIGLDVRALHGGGCDRHFEWKWTGKNSV